jgi:mannose/fructose/N-acetylgalactosamine-specific phosphotransferase system component IID
MNDDLISAILAWILPMFVYGLDQLMYRHGSQEYAKNNYRSLFTSIEGAAILFGSTVLFALMKTWVIFRPESTFQSTSMIVVLITSQLVIVSSLYLFWKSFPEMPSFFGWRDSRKPLAVPDQAVPSD